jgi:hypothetical protein
MSKSEVKECTSQKEIIVIGMSRERNIFFDINEFREHNFKFEKLTGSKTIGTVHFISVHDSQVIDRMEWNEPNGTMLKPVRSFGRDLGDMAICSRDYTRTSGREVHIFFTEDYMRIVGNSKEENWFTIISTYFNSIRLNCPNAIIHYKTTTAIRSQYESLSWQRIYSASRISLQIAEFYNMSVTDSFCDDPRSDHGWGCVSRCYSFIF